MGEGEGEGLALRVQRSSPRSAVSLSQCARTPAGQTLHLEVGEHEQSPVKSQRYGTYKIGHDVHCTHTIHIVPL